VTVEEHLENWLITLDEMLFAFRDRCCFCVHIPSKPDRYEIKGYALVRTTYVVKLEVYTGQQPDIHSSFPKRLWI
jgi:hypothetical protein